MSIRDIATTNAEGGLTLPSKFKEFADVFSKEDSSILPKHAPYDLAIKLEEGKQPP